MRNKPISIWGGVVQLTLTRPLNQSAERMAKSKFWVWLDRSFQNVTFFHLAGLALMIFGAHFGEASQFDAKYVKFHVTFTQLVGAVSFFYELIKARVKKSPEAK